MDGESSERQRRSSPSPGQLGTEQRCVCSSPTTARINQKLHSPPGRNSCRRQRRRRGGGPPGQQSDPPAPRTCSGKRGDRVQMTRGLRPHPSRAGQHVTLLAEARGCMCKRASKQANDSCRGLAIPNVRQSVCQGEGQLQRRGGTCLLRSAGAAGVAVAGTAVAVAGNALPGTAPAARARHVQAPALCKAPSLSSAAACQAGVPLCSRSAAAPLPSPACGTR